MESCCEREGCSRRRLRVPRDDQGARQQAATRGSATGPPRRGRQLARISRAGKRSVPFGTPNSLGSAPAGRDASLSIRFRGLHHQLRLDSRRCRHWRSRLFSNPGPRLSTRPVTMGAHELIQAGAGRGLEPQVRSELVEGGWAQAAHPAAQIVQRSERSILPGQDQPAHQGRTDLRQCPQDLGRRGVRVKHQLRRHHDRIARRRIHRPASHGQPQRDGDHRRGQNAPRPDRPDP